MKWSWTDILSIGIGLGFVGILTAFIFLKPIILEAEPEPPSEPRGLVRIYGVQKGDTLWGISEKGIHYGDPYLWPLIRQEASGVPKIIDPDLILPNQRLVIRPVKPATRFPRGATTQVPISYNEIREAEIFARTRGLWSLYDGK